MAEISLHLHIGSLRYTLRQPGHSIAIPLNFNGPQPNTYGVPIAQSAAFASGGWIGDTRQGGSCNFETYHFTPHCNGTHTECVGHILDERVKIHEQLQESLIPATLISVVPMTANFTEDSYDPELHSEDLVIDFDCLQRALAGSDLDFHSAIIIRTLPNLPGKQARDYMQHPPAFFTLEAMRYLKDLGVQHLLVDMPSVDRLFDEGKLNAHHIYWGLAAGSHQMDPKTIPSKTITEMIFVPDALADGKYLLNLQIAPFMSDAAPSRPVLYALNPA
jgi:kynurenine formamidase